jgi:protein TonB
MEVIFILIGIVLIISLYDYYSAKGWQQVTSEVRNEVVFEKRNKKYGAYVMRKDYNKRFILILVGLLGSVGATCAAIFISTEKPKIVYQKPTSELEDTIVIEFRKDDPLPEVEVETQQLDRETSTEKFVEIQVTDNPDLETKINIIDDESKIGVEDKKGDEEEDFTPPIIEKGKGKEVVQESGDVFAEPLIDIDESARFPGGTPEMMRFLNANLKYPTIGQELGIQGKCYMQFVVRKDGEISNVKVIRGINDYPEFSQEAMRVIKMMPKWQPGKDKGRAVDSYFQLPIQFKFEE